MNDRLECLLQELSVAINKSVSKSEQVRDLIEQIGCGGYDVLLFLNSTITMMKREGGAVGVNNKVEPEFNAQDIEFLQSMQISLKR